MLLAGLHWSSGLIVGWRVDCATHVFGALLLTGVILPYLCEVCFLLEPLTLANLLFLT